MKPSLQERLKAYAIDARLRAKRMPEGPQRDQLMAMARQADIAAHLEDWINPPGLQPPETPEV